MCKATVLILKDRGEEITQRMYEIAFAERLDYKRAFETTWMQQALLIEDMKFF